VIHADFLDWFRAAYEKARALMPEEQRRYHDEYQQELWMEVLGMLR